MENETNLYPTDILLSKYVTVLEAARICSTSIPKIIELISTKQIPYAELKVEGKRSRVIHVNHEDVSRVLLEKCGAVS